MALSLPAFVFALGISPWSQFCSVLFVPLLASPTLPWSLRPAWQECFLVLSLCFSGPTLGPTSRVEKENPPALSRRPPLFQSRIERAAGSPEEPLAHPRCRRADDWASMREIGLMPK